MQELRTFDNGMFWPTLQHSEQIIVDTLIILAVCLSIIAFSDLANSFVNNL